MNEQDDASVDDVADLINRDPALAVKLLKTANSSMFGLPREVTSVRQAVMVLGLRSVNLLALSFSLTSTARGESAVPFDYRRYWTHTIAMTVAARYIADLNSPSVKDEAFIAGLLSDIGQLLLAEHAPDEYRPVLQELKTSSRPVHEVEQELIGTTHAALGQELLETWGLPDLLCGAVGAHHDSSAIDESNDPLFTLARVVHFASECADVLVAQEGQLEQLVEVVRQRGAEYYEMSNQTCADLLEVVGNRLGDTADALEVDLEDPATLLETRLRASELLVRESLMLSQQVHSVSDQVERLEGEKQELQLRATTDSLTGLRNRGFFDQALQGAIDDAKQRGRYLGLLILDLDHFKRVNDTYGHTTGDELLRRVASAVLEQIRDGDSACRYGGEEISVICPEVSMQGLERVAEKIRAAVEAITLPCDSGTVQATISIGGTAASPGSLKTPLGLVEIADRELYRAKSEGRNRVCLTFDDGA